MAQPNLRGKLVLIVGICQLFLACFTLPLQAEEKTSNIAKPETVAAPPAETTGAVGIASYYAKRYNGRRTNSGARYDPQKLTAAHSDLPLGTRVKVVNLANNREVVVVVNDRCRKRKSPFIDLSRAAAKELGFLGKGTAKVRIIPLTDESS